MAGPIAELVGAFVSGNPQTEHHEEKRLMSVKEAARYLAVPPSTLYRRIWERRVPFVRLGRSVRFDRRDLDVLIESNKVQASDDRLPTTYPSESVD